MLASPDTMVLNNSFLRFCQPLSDFVSYCQNKATIINVEDFLEKKNVWPKRKDEMLFNSMSLSTCDKIEFVALFAHLKWTTRTRSFTLTLGKNWSDWSPIRKFLSFSLHLLNILLSKRFMLSRNAEIKIWKAIASFEKVI